MSSPTHTANGFTALPNDLAGVELMCEQLYTASDAAVRNRAESTLLSLANSPANLSQCTMILENSKVCLYLLFTYLFS